MSVQLPVVQTASGASSRGSHQLACAKQCARKWTLRYRQRIIPNTEPPFRLGGTLIHDAVAHRYAQRLIAAGGMPTWWEDQDIDSVLQQGGAGHPDLIQCAREVYDEYPRFWWDLNNEPWDPVAVEEEFRATVVELHPEGAGGPEDDEVVTCRTDLVVRNRDTGDLWVVDHKTKSHGWTRGDGPKKLPTWKPDGEYAISWQANINLHIIRKRYPHDTVRGFIINRITRQPPYCFDRHVLSVSPRVYNTVPRVVREAVATELAIDGTLAAGHPPMPSYWECYGRYGECDYRRLCNADTVEDMNAILALHYVNRE